jgi:hypothetical protein
MEQATDFFERVGELGGVAVAEVPGQDEVVAALLERSLGDVHEARLVLLATSSEPFRDIGWDRNCCPAQLHRQAIRLVPRETRREGIDCQHKSVGLLPYHQIAKGSCRSR